MADISTGITISFATSGFTAEIVDVTPPGASRESLDSSHQATEDYKTSIPADLAEWGELKLRIWFDPATEPPITGAAEAITMTFPDATTWTFSGFMTGYEPDAPLGELMAADVTVKVSGEVTIA